MTDDRSESGAQELNFDRAEFEEAREGPPRCTVCDSELFGTYFEINTLATCERCRFQVEEEYHAGSASGRFFRALAGGLVAGALGAAIWYAVQELTGYQVGLIAIVVGWLVGKAVRWGCNARGGWVYQGMAMTLTYLAIVSTFVPEIVHMMHQVANEPGQVVGEAEAGLAGGGDQPAAAADTDQPAAAADAPAEEPAEEAPAVADAPPSILPAPVIFLLAVVFIAGLAMAAPFLSGSIMGLIIIGIGVYEAWRQNRKLVLAIEGPFQITSRPPAAARPPAGEEPAP